MSRTALTAKYRPQTFAEVAGQDTLKTILSRASREGKVAPAYLFSGTRGVGKTTLARIFAKALNCRTAPTGEPCNVCDQCRAVTQGNAVDVVEIDGASNRGIDDVRRLKEVVGYAAMEGGYKIFIIDEAHMLSREAFNALLKTLEEPPPKVTFILATTEPHKFPATIISRCQHYVFKRLPEAVLTDHLTKVLRREEITFDDAAVRLIARRGAGSVRDAMSLLGQVLALGAEKLTEETTRGVLGLAGQEAFLRMLTALGQGDSLTLVRILREMLDQGLDMGFFLRELSSLWRDLFMLRQSGRAALAVVELPEEEARALLAASETFTLPHIHACWQMTLEGQRRVLTSLEPALALELLLLNLAMLPKLLSLESLSALGRRGAPTPSGTGQGPANTPEGQGGGHGNIPGGGTPGGPTPRSFSAATAGDGSFASPTPPAGRGTPPEPPARTAMPEIRSTASAPPVPPRGSASPVPAPEVSPGCGAPTVEVQNAALNGPSPGQKAQAARAEHAEEPCDDDPGLLEPDLSEADIQAALMEETPTHAPQRSLVPEAPLPGPSAAAPAPEQKPDWEAVLEQCRGMEAPTWFLSLAAHIRAEWKGEELFLSPHDIFTSEQMQEPEASGILAAALTALCGVMPALTLRPPATVRKTREQMHDEIHGHPLVLEMQKHFGARVLDYGQIR